MGSYKEIDASAPEVQQAATFAVQQLGEQSNSLLPPQLEEVCPEEQHARGVHVGFMKGLAAHAHVEVQQAAEPAAQQLGQQPNSLLPRN